MNPERHAPDPNLVGQRIRVLRRRRHLTQAALAEKAGIRTGPMNTIENGHHLPSLPVLCRLAEVFGVGVDHLLATDTPPYMVREAAAFYDAPPIRSETVFMAIAGSYEAERAMMLRFDPPKQPLDMRTAARLEAVMHAFLSLEDIVGVPKQAAIPLERKLPIRESGLTQFVAGIRALFGINAAVIFDYLELFENAGLRIVFLPLPDDVQSVSCYDRANRNVFFFIAQTLNVERQLFRLCYELGRVYLFNGGLLGKRKLGRLDAEHAARRFAALFLMPEESVACSVEQVGMGPRQWNWDMLMRLKHRFGVSAEAFLYRLDEIGLIAPTRRDELKAEIYAFYEAHAFAEPDSTRRILTPNGRLGDLLLAAAIRQPKCAELPDITTTLKQNGVKTP